MTAPNTVPASSAPRVNPLQRLWLRELGMERLWLRPAPQLFSSRRRHTG